MRLDNSFTVGLPPEQAWAVLTDPERVAPCLPGVHLDEVDGDEVRGGLRVKVGPISAEYSGVAEFRSRDRQAGVVVVAASGREVRGRGSASATVTLRLAPAEEGTRVDLATELALTGRLAQFGRGVLGEVTGRLVGEFAQALADEVAGSRRPAAAAPRSTAALSRVTAAEPVAEVVDLAAEAWPDDEPAGAVPAAGGSRGSAGGVGSTRHASDGNSSSRDLRNDSDTVVLRAIAIPVAKRVVPVVAALVAAAVLARRLRR
ncbi:SRPBCC family protein [Amycolatopsis sp. FDAARGOS 1241]|uniref:SRPBCC family protein n=1 Tax=Amycolatopsis sp. FDAARGOS 1241 TaxID=2778070 RepID=UPI00194DEE7D|nr:SRPBCC family protein [Amycolatopsis sp. FDAARGOS 1241]QRP43118.1 SRPBCC family protein [Amycolatopsis sp. FDAARGOS 1241]